MEGVAAWAFVKRAPCAMLAVDTARRELAVANRRHQADEEIRQEALPVRGAAAMCGKGNPTRRLLPEMRRDVTPNKPPWQAAPLGSVRPTHSIEKKRRVSSSAKA